MFMQQQLYLTKNHLTEMDMAVEYSEKVKDDGERLIPSG